MKLLKKLAIALLALVGVFVLVGLVLPRQWRVERSITIAAPPERIYPFIANLRRWQDWSVWTKAMDPVARHSYGAVPEGVGAEWAWLGPKIGRGKMKIIEADPPRRLAIAEAIEADAPNARATFTFSAELAPNGAATKVTWLDEGELPPVMGGYFRGMVERMLTENFDSGLGKLKGLVEALPPPPPVAPAPVELRDASAPETSDAAVLPRDGG